MRPVGARLDHVQRCDPFRMPVGLRHAGVDQKAVPVLHQRMPHEAELRLLCPAAQRGRKEAVPSRTEGIPSWAEGNPSQSEGIPNRAEGNPSRAEGIPNVCLSLNLSLSM